MGLSCGPDAKFAPRVVSLLARRRVRFPLLALWVALAIAGGALAPGMIKNTTDTLGQPPADSASAKATQWLDENTPGGAVVPLSGKPGPVPLVVYLWAADGSSGGGGGDETPDDRDLVASGTAQRNYTADVCARIVARIAELGGGGRYVQSVQGYFEALREGLPEQVARSFVGKGGRSLIIPVIINNRFDGPAPVDFSLQLGQAVSDACAAVPAAGMRGEVLGMPSFMRSIQASVERDMLICDGTAIPLALVVVALVVRSARLLVVPILTLAVSATTAFGVMAIPAAVENFTVVTVAVSLMGSTLVALSLDYSLFLLTRFQEGLRAGMGMNEAIADMLQGSGHTVLVSGLTLAAAFFGLMVIPLDVLRSMGLGAGVCTLCVMAANLTFLPALILSFPGFFIKAREPFHFRAKLRRFLCCCSCCPWKRSASTTTTTTSSSTTSFTSSSPPSAGRASSLPSARSNFSAAARGAYDSEIEGLLRGQELDTSAESDDDYDDSSDDGAEPGTAGDNIVSVDFSSALDSPRRSDDAETTRLRGSRWYKVGKLITRWPYNLLTVVLVAAATAPFGYFAFDFPTTSAVNLGMDRWSNVTNAYNQMNEAFGYGYLAPYTMILEPVDSVELISDEFFAAAQGVIKGMTDDLDNLDCANITGMAQAACTDIPTTIVKMCVKSEVGKIIPIANKLCLGVNQLYDQSVVEHDGARGMLFRIMLPWDPQGTAGHLWYAALLRSIDKQQGLHKAHVKSILVNGGSGWDMVNEAYSFFPAMIGITSAVIIFVLGFAFKSILIPIRALFTIALTLLFAYGWSALMYVYGALQWTQFYGFDASSEAIMWVQPVLSFSILVGLSTDYDMFLLVRIRENWLKGINTRESIRLGLAQSGNVISAAGIIMAIAFSGLFFSATPAMNQLSAYLVFAVLYDTFITRPLVVPALFSMFLEANWWPGSMLREKGTLLERLRATCACRPSVGKCGASV